mmetsp:Transcript_61545/g.146833  ORF Transcript_61545/g.146833 Transcript_61545/m.146833 type:complete len:177 (-) Transcript_61545:483-1013(-)
MPENSGGSGARRAACPWNGLETIALPGFLRPQEDAFGGGRGASAFHGKRALVLCRAIPTVLPTMRGMHAGRWTPACHVPTSHADALGLRTMTWTTTATHTLGAQHLAVPDPGALPGLPMGWSRDTEATTTEISEKGDLRTTTVTTTSGVTIGTTFSGGLVARRASTLVRTRTSHVA